MDGDDRVPILLRHVEDHPVAQDARVIDHDVELAKVVDGALKNALGGFEVGDAFEVGYGLAAAGADLPDHLFGGRTRLPGAVEMSPQVIDHHFSAVLRHQQGFFPSDSAPRSGDDRDLAFQKCHWMIPLSILIFVPERPCPAINPVFQTGTLGSTRLLQRRLDAPGV